MFINFIVWRFLQRYFVQTKCKPIRRLKPTETFPLPLWSIFSHFFFFPDILTFYTNVNKHMLMQHGILWNWNIWLLKLKRSICIERPGLYYLYWDKTYLQTTKKEWKTKIFIGPTSNLRLLEASYKAMKITKVSYLKLNIMNV